MARAAAPEAAVTACPDCREEQVHDVLQAPGPSGDATVRCRECGRVHKTVLKPSRTVEVPIIVSRNEESQRGTVPLAEDEELAVEDELVALEQQVQVRAIDRKDGKRVRKAKARDVGTLWAIHFEEILVKVAVNMGQKTISKSVPVAPRDSFTVGDHFDLDKLRIVIHAIRTPEGTLHRGAAEAKDITRIFARPVRLNPQERRERREELGLPPPKPRRRPAPPEAVRRSKAEQKAKAKAKAEAQAREGTRTPPRVPRRPRRSPR